MESNINNMNKNKTENQSGKIWAGLFIIGIGAVLLLRNVGLDLPRWLFSWSTLLMVIGFFIGLKHRFRHSGWIIMVLIGGYFTLEKAFDFDFDFHRVTLPVFLVLLGLYLIFRPKYNFKENYFERRERESSLNETGEDFDDVKHKYATEDRATNAQDYIDSVNVFGGSHQIVYSKNFKGGEITAVFGGCDVNLTQADFEGQVEIDVTAIFGGCKIVVPAGWQVKSEVTSVFGGLDDKRGVQPGVEGDRKLLVIRGIALFGGVDIRNF